MKLAYFVFACFFIVFQYALRVSAGVLLSHFQSTFHLSAYELSLLSSSYYLGYLLFMLPIGMLIDRHGLYRIWQYSLLLLILSCILFGLALNLPLLIAARFLMGVASSGIIIGGIAMSIHLFPKQKGLFIGIVVAMCTIGILIGQGPWAYAVSILPTWQDTFWLSAVIGMLLFMFWSILGRQLSWPKTASTLGIFVQIIKPLCKSRFFWILAFYIFILSSIQITFNVLWGPQFFASYYHTSLTQAAYLNSLLPVGNLIGALLIGFITDRLTRLKPTLILGGIFTTVLVILVLEQRIHIPIFLCGLILFALGILQSLNVIVFAKISEHFPRLPSASVQSIVNIFNIAGGPVLQLITGYLMTLQVSNIYQQLTASNIGNTLLIIPALMLIATLIIFALPKIQRPSN